MSSLGHAFLPLLKEYYQRVITSARSAHSPLLADGIDTLTGEPVLWTYPDGVQVPMSNFASQQNLLRALCAMTTVTGDEQYRAQAECTTAYFFSRYQDQNSGLLHWGGHRFVHLNSGNIEGPASKECVHELKHHFPFYDLLHQVAPAQTCLFLQGFWAAHVNDWEKLDLSRHGQYGKGFNAPIFSQHIPGPVVDPARWPDLPHTVGLTFVNAATDLIYAACHYYCYSGDTAAKLWAKHLYRQFVLARHPDTGMPVYQFSSPLQRKPVPTDDNVTYSWFGDRAARQFGPEFGAIAKEANVLFRDCWPVVVDNPLAMLQCAKMLDDDELTEWIVSGITAYFQYAWHEEHNMMLPMWNSGVDMSNYVLQRDGYYGKKGTVIKRYPADCAYLLTLIRASVLSADKTLRGLTSRMFSRFGLGELDSATLTPVRVCENTSLASDYLIFALLDLHEYCGDKRLLMLAEKVGTNLVSRHFQRGYFLPDAQHRFARLDDPMPYALVALEAAKQGLYQQIPLQISTGGYLHGEQLIGDELQTVYDRAAIYARVMSAAELDAMCESV